MAALCSLQDLSSQTKDRTTCIERQILNQWTTREVPTETLEGIRNPLEGPILRVSDSGEDSKVFAFLATSFLTLLLLVCQSHFELHETRQEMEEVDRFQYTLETQVNRIY